MTASDLDLRLQRFRLRRDGQAKVLATALIEAGRPHDALEVIHLRLLETDPEPELLGLEGRALYEQGDLRAAQAALLRAIKANPQRKEPYRLLGQVLIERGDPRRAVQVLERAVRLDPADASLRQALGRAQRLAVPQAARGQPAIARRASDHPDARRASEPPARARRASEPPARESRPSARPPSRPPADLRLEGGSRAMAAAPHRSGAREHAQSLSDAVVEDPTLRHARQPHARARPREELPFDDEVDRDDDAPTRAIEMRDALRTLRESDRARRSSTPPGSFSAPEPLEGGDEDPTSIVPSVGEIEVLAAARGERREDEDVGDVTVIGSPALLAGIGTAEPKAGDRATEDRPAVAPTPSMPAAPSGTRAQRQLVRSLALGWGLALVIAAGAYLAFQSWHGQRKQESSDLVARAQTVAYDGQHAALEAAVESLEQARALDPRSPRVMEALLFVHAMRVLEEGAQELPALRQTLERAVQQKLDSRLVLVAKLVIGTPEQQRAGFDELLARVHRDAERDARIAYLVGRLAQRIGSFDRAKSLLAQATVLAPGLSRAWLAQGELARMEGQFGRAKELFERALGPDRRALRAELWLALLAGRTRPAGELIETLDELAKRADQEADPERLLAASGRSGAQLAMGDAAGARATLKQASALHVQDPELLTLFAERALDASEPLLAYRAAHAASKASGGAPRYQALLATTLLEQPDGGASLLAESGLGEGHGVLAIARAEAALLTDVREALEVAKRELAAYRATPEGREDIEASSLLMRIDLRLGANVESLLPAARALAQRAPSSAPAHFALAEALITAGQAQAGLDALEPAVRLSPGAADTHYLTGRAQQLLGRAEEARESLERALAVAPGHVEARLALGRTLLDAGDYDAALGLMRGIEQRAGGAALLGIIEALLGKRKLDEAAARLSTLPDPLKPAPAVAQLRARLALLRARPLEALEVLAPLVGEESEARSADALSLYGDALLASERLDGAVLAYDGALELDPSHPDALLGRARAALRVDKPEVALAWITRAEAALALRPRPPEMRAVLHITAGRAELERQQPARAKDRFTRAEALPDAPAEVHFWLGEVLAGNDAPAAAKRYQRYLELEPGGPYVARAQRAISPR